MDKFIPFYNRFPLGRVVEAAVLGGLKIPHGFQLHLMVLLNTHQDGKNPD